MAFSFDQIFAADPANPQNVAANASVLIYAPGDATKTPLTITDPSGSPLANPVTVNANGFGSAFMHATLDRVAWDGGGFTGFFTSYEGMKNVAVAAQEAAEAAGSTAAEAATAGVASVVADADAAATAAAASATAAANAAALVGAPADSAIATAINGSATATKAALNATYATSAALTGKLDKTEAATSYAALAPGGNIQATVRKLADVVADVKILVVGDSTAAQVGQWPDKLLPLIQARYPHRTYRKTIWGGASYPAPTTVTTGTPGTVNLDLYMGAVSGTIPETSYATWDAQVSAVQPDLIIVHTGHNYGATAAGGGFSSDAQMDQVTKERFTRYICALKESCPTADIMLTSQNPYLTAGTRANLSNIRAQFMRDLAADLGCAYGPILEAYLATGNPASYLQADLLHPLTTAGGGAELAANTLDPYFKYDPRLLPTVRRPSPLTERANNFAPNGDFASFASPPTLPSWTALNSTLSKDTTNYESANGYAVKIAAAAGTGNATAYASLPIKRIKGKLVTVAARIRKPAATSSTGGRVSLSGDGGLTTVTSGSLSSANDLFVWAFVTVRIPNAATFATLTLLAGTAGTTDEITVDRVTVSIGHLPHDV